MDDKIMSQGEINARAFTAFGLAIGLMMFLAWAGDLSYRDYYDTRDNAKSLCLECGYPDYTRDEQEDAWYCVRLEGGTEVVVPVDEACSLP